MNAADPHHQPPGGRLAISVVHCVAPVLRMRYRQGVLIGPTGFPDWALCARAVVQLPPAPAGLTRDEIRVLDVLTANAEMAVSAAHSDGDPLWSQAPVLPAHAVATPPGWCWAHLPADRRLALVPIELHGSFRHAGGLWASGLPSTGLRTGSGAAPVGRADGAAVPEDLMDLLERALGWPLPPAYRRFLTETDGAGPSTPGVLAGHGFIADQPLFGLARADRHQEVSYAATWLRDRFTLDYLPIGYVQGGVLAVKVSGDDLDSVWYWDDDDPRDREAYDAAYVCDRLLHRCADSIDHWWAALTEPPAALVELAGEWTASGQVMQVRDDVVGAGLPATHRPPWRPAARAGRDPLAALFEAR